MSNKARVDYSAELESARRIGTHREVLDLQLLVNNSIRDINTEPLPGAKAAASRQSQRRWLRKGTPGAQSMPSRALTPALPTPALPTPAPATPVRRWAKVPNGEIWPIDREDYIIDGHGKRGAMCAWRADRPRDFCPISMVVWVPEPTAPATPPLLTACDAFYHACRDASDQRSWEAFDAACEAYEVALADLGV